MPQPRQRIVFCDCLDCREQPSATDVTSLSPANEAVARQEPPPKCLMICASGCLLPAAGSSSSSETCSTSLASSLPHLHKAARDGNLTLLALREQGQDIAAGSSSALAELEQLLGVHEERGRQRQGEDVQLSTLADKFKGMQAAFASNNQQACALAAHAGMDLVSILAPGSDEDGDDAAGMFSSFSTKADVADADAAQTQQLQLPSPPEAARRMLEQLDLASSHHGVDLVMVHVDAATATVAATQPAAGAAQPSSSSSASSWEAAVQVLQWLDRTLRYLNNSTALRETVLLTVVLTPGTAQLDAALPGSLWLQPGGAALERGGGGAGSSGRPVPEVLRPQQSFQVAAGEGVKVDMQRPLLCLRRLPGVVRRDGAARLGLAEWAGSGGQQALLAERLLPEIAYKVGRAPKYGA